MTSAEPARPKQAQRRAARTGSMAALSEKPVAGRQTTGARAAAAKPAEKAEAPEARPPKMRKPAKPDDLKLISGIGPKIESTLNGLGIYKYEQIANWRKAERQWIAGRLPFPRRIEREDWVKQAKALAKGGAEEYVKVFGKKPR